MCAVELSCEALQSCLDMSAGQDAAGRETRF